MQRAGTVQLQVFPDLTDSSTLIPLGVYVAALVATSAMQSKIYGNVTVTATAAVDDEELYIDGVIAAEEDAMMEAQTDAILEEIAAVEEVQAEMEETITKEQAPAPKPAPKPVVKPVATTTASATSKPVSTSTPVETKTTTTTTASTESKTETDMTPKATLPKATSTPRFQVFRKKKSETEKSISELKRQVSSTLEGEREKEQRLRKAAAKREAEAATKKPAVESTSTKKAPAVKVNMNKAAAATAATAAATTKTLQLQKTSTTAMPMTTDDDNNSTDTAAEDNNVEEEASTSTEPPKQLRRKAWRVVKKVVAPWRKWKNIS